MAVEPGRRLACCYAPRIDEHVIGTIDDPSGEETPWIEVVEDEPDSPYIDIRDPQYETILQVPRQAVPALIEILQRVRQS